jgi:hypothetical protein
VAALVPVVAETVTVCIEAPLMLSTGRPVMVLVSAGPRQASFAKLVEAWAKGQRGWKMAVGAGSEIKLR